MWPGWYWTPRGSSTGPVVTARKTVIPAYRRRPRGGYSGVMQLLLTALTTVQRASQILEAAGPGNPQTHRHWQQARVHLSAARHELLQALEGWKPSLPPGAEGLSSDLCEPFSDS